MKIVGILTAIFALEGCAGAPSAPPCPPVEKPAGRETIAALRLAADTDSDGDGLSDYAELHKYFTDPHRVDTAGRGIPDGDWNQRREFTYTLSAVLRLAKPATPLAMNDDYQDARVVAEDADSFTVEIVYYPLNDNHLAIAENPSWARDDAALAEYLAPSVTANWDAGMRERLLAELGATGIRWPDGKPRISDGPFTEAKEIIGGFWLWQVKSKEEALEWIKRCPVSPGQMVELRRVYEAEDFGPALTPELREAEERLRREVASRK